MKLYKKTLISALKEVLDIRYFLSTADVHDEGNCEYLQTKLTQFDQHYKALMKMVNWLELTFDKSAKLGFVRTPGAIFDAHGDWTPRKAPVRAPTRTSAKLAKVNAELAALALEEEKLAREEAELERQIQEEAKRNELNKQQAQAKVQVASPPKTPRERFPMRTDNKIKRLDAILEAQRLEEAKLAEEELKVFGRVDPFQISRAEVAFEKEEKTAEEKVKSKPEAVAPSHGLTPGEIKEKSKNEELTKRNAVRHLPVAQNGPGTFL